MTKEEFIKQKKEAKKKDLTDRSIEGWYEIINPTSKKKEGDKKNEEN